MVIVIVTIPVVSFMVLMMVKNLQYNTVKQIVLLSLNSVCTTKEWI